MVGGLYRGRTVKEVRAIVGAILAKKKNLDNVTVSHGWWDGFRARHLKLTMRTRYSSTSLSRPSTAPRRPACTPHKDPIYFPEDPTFYSKSGVW